MLLDLSDETWEEMIDVNLTGVWRTIKATVPHMVAGGRGGSVILTSSAGGLKGYHSTGHYSAAKHGVVGLMRTLALELAPQMIRVNSVHPGSVGTDMILNDFARSYFLAGQDDQSVEAFARAARSHNVMPIDWVEPADISKAVLYLASDDARYVTGVTLPIDAGSLVK
jgi:NAD(P)-dependent dehydrogenase (short-subunit alcohol dehydrogenase family)